MCVYTYMFKGKHIGVLSHISGQSCECEVAGRIREGPLTSQQAVRKSSMKKGIGLCLWT